VGAYLAETLEADVLYLLGPGTTVKAVADALGVGKTLLGVDAVLNGALVGRDLNERGILDLLAGHPAARIVVTPLGGNGFIFGRGNKQFTPAVIWRVGVDHVLIISSREKLRKLACLRVDSGDAELDAALAGYRSVLVGFRYSKMAKVEC
jgi:predicted polyphosphate/ATP-dependent NAD kinase